MRWIVVDNKSGNKASFFDELEAAHFVAMVWEFFPDAAPNFAYYRED
jgi:hypothetical protein